jgi:glycerol-3-phosphate dehydrogenase
MRERLILERTASHARFNTGGLFVQLSADPPEFAEQFTEACRATSIPYRTLSSADVAAREPYLTPVVRGFTVPDAVFRPWELITALAEDASFHGAAIRTQETVTRIDSNVGGCEVEVRAADGDLELLRARTVVIAAGPWSAELATMAGQVAPMELAKGAMLIIPERIVTAVVNRCRPPGSFDILVPLGDVTIFGTTSRDADVPDAIDVETDEQAELLTHVRAMATRHIDRREPRLSTYAGVRPLAASAVGADGAVSRRHVVITEGATSVITVVGGSFTTHRAMAEEAVDEVCARLGTPAACTTADATLPPPRGLFAWSKDAALQPARASNSVTV